MLLPAFTPSKGASPLWTPHQGASPLDPYYNFFNLKIFIRLIKQHFLYSIISEYYR